MRHLLIFVVSLVMMLSGIHAYANNVREVNWGDLVPADTDFFSQVAHRSLIFVLN